MPKIVAPKFLNMKPCNECHPPRPSFGSDSSSSDDTLRQLEWLSGKKPAADPLARLRDQGSSTRPNVGVPSYTEKLKSDPLYQWLLKASPEELRLYSLVASAAEAQKPSTLPPPKPYEFHAVSPQEQAAKNWRLSVERTKSVVFPGSGVPVDWGYLDQQADIERRMAAMRASEASDKQKVLQFVLEQIIIFAATDGLGKLLELGAQVIRTESGGARLLYQGQSVEFTEAQMRVLTSPTRTGIPKNGIAPKKLPPGQVDPKSLNITGSTQGELFSGDIAWMRQQLRNNPEKFWKDTVAEDGKIKILEIQGKRYLSNGNHRWHAAVDEGVTIPDWAIEFQLRPEYRGQLTPLDQMIRLPGGR